MFLSSLVWIFSTLVGKVLKRFNSGGAELKIRLKMADRLSVLQKLNQTSELDSWHNRKAATTVLELDDGCVGDSAKTLVEEEEDPSKVQTENVNKALLLETPPAHPELPEESFGGDEFINIDSEIMYPGNINFDAVIGAIEDIVMEEEFHKVQTSYLNKFWEEFSEDHMENSDSHFDMFKEYSQGISSFIESNLKTLLSQFDMGIFMEQLGARGDLDGDIFEMLFTLTDYVKFKELVLDYRAMRTGNTVDVSQGISVKSVDVENMI